jgi:hypothetical protein
MRNLSIFLFVVSFLAACNSQPQSSNSNNVHDGEELNIRDFGPCMNCENEGLLVNPTPQDWTAAEKDFYNIGLQFWEQTTNFLFTSEMLALYTQKGARACHDRFIGVISGKVGSDGNSVSMEDDIRWYGWRNQFDESAISQMRAAEPCEEDLPEPEIEDTEAHDQWMNSVFKCIDVVFRAGVPACMYVERPILRNSTTAIIRLKLYDTVDAKGVPHLVSAFYYYFEKMENKWFFTMRRDS